MAPRFERFVQLIRGADFDFDGESGLLRVFDRLADAAGGRDVVVLDQDRVIEAHAVVCHSARGRGRFFEMAHSGRGLARIEHLALRSFDDRGVFVREGCYSGKALEKIQSHSFAFEQRAGEASDGGDAVAFLKVVAVFVEKR